MHQVACPKCDDAMFLLGSDLDYERYSCPTCGWEVEIPTDTEELEAAASILAAKGANR